MLRPSPPLLCAELPYHRSEMDGEQYGSLRWRECCVCTNQLLGDDAGDLPVKYLSRAAIPAGHYRIATIHSGQDWVDLVLKYPMVMVPSGTSDWVEEWSGQHVARG